MNTNKDPWNDIYNEAHKSAFDDFTESRMAIRRIDEKINRYLVILSIVLVPSVNLFLYFVKSEQGSFQTSPHIFSYLSILFLLLFICVFFSLFICVKSLKYTNVADVITNDLILSYYKNCKSRNDEISLNAYHLYIFNTYSQAAVDNKKTTEEKINKIKPLTYTISCVFFLLFLITSSILFL